MKQQHHIFCRLPSMRSDQPPAGGQPPLQAHHALDMSDGDYLTKSTR